MVITVLSGGVGAARLIAALSETIDPIEITAVVNVGDDLTMHGLTISPDLDTIMYTLAGLNNRELGWGLQGESWRVMDELDALGGEAWFRLGDRDLATHLYRSQRLSLGATKSEVTTELCERLGVRVRLLPVTDDVIATTFDTAIGPMSFPGVLRSPPPRRRGHRDRHRRRRRSDGDAPGARGTARRLAHRHRTVQPVDIGRTDSPRSWGTRDP